MYKLSDLLEYSKEKLIEIVLSLENELMYYRKE